MVSNRAKLLVHQAWPAADPPVGGAASLPRMPSAPRRVPISSLHFRKNDFPDRGRVKKDVPGMALNISLEPLQMNLIGLRILLPLSRYVRYSLGPF